jgi:hypothetical protein
LTVDTLVISKNKWIKIAVVSYLSCFLPNFPTIAYPIDAMLIRTAASIRRVLSSHKNNSWSTTMCSRSRGLASTAQYQEEHGFRHRPHQPPPLEKCELDVNGESYRQSMERTRLQVEELNGLLDQVQQGGGVKAVQRHASRNKLLPRDRIQRLVDPGTPLLELSALAGCMDDIPSGGIVTAIGVVCGQLCMMIANDAVS